MRDADRTWAVGFGSLAAALLIAFWLVTGTALAAGGCTGCEWDCIRWVWATGQCRSGYTPMQVKDQNCNVIGTVYMECTEAICSRKCAPPDANTEYNWDCTARADSVDSLVGCAVPTVGRGTMCTNNCFGKFCAGAESENRCREVQIVAGGYWSPDNIRCQCAAP